MLLLLKWFFILERMLKLMTLQCEVLETKFVYNCSEARLYFFLLLLEFELMGSGSYEFTKDKCYHHQWSG